jgi:hypothetical protein
MGFPRPFEVQVKRHGYRYRVGVLGRVLYRAVAGVYLHYLSLLIV